MKNGFDGRRLNQYVRALLVSGFWVVVSGCCCRSVDQTPKPQRYVTVVRFACPGDPVVIDKVDATTGAILQTVQGIPASEPITDIPEFHDCQRLIDSTGHYDSLYAIFAAFRLESLPSSFYHDSSANQSGQQYGVLPVATIYSHGGTYPPLGIEPGFNCLVFFRRFNTSAWSAKMVPWGGDTDPDCTRLYDPYTSTGTELEVRPLPQDFEPNDFPPVARWDWDSRLHQHYVGIACGPTWCEVGKSGFHPSGSYATPALTWKELGGVLPSPASPKFNRVFKVKGWFDVQRIENTASGTMTVGPLGFVFPHPLLDSINEAGGLDAYSMTQWNHVANAVVVGDYPKWNFTNGVNQIFFCYGTMDHCGMSDNLPRVSGSPTQLSMCPLDPTNHDFRWWAKIVSASDKTAYVCVQRTDHSLQLGAYNQDKGTSIRIPGAARWRFLPNDAGDWISCPTGCCTIKN